MAHSAIGCGTQSSIPRSGDDCRKSHLATFLLGSSDQVQHRCRLRSIFGGKLLHGWVLLWVMLYTIARF